MQFFEPQVLLVLRGGAPFFVEDLRRTGLYRVFFLQRLAFLATLVFGVASRPGVTPSAGISWQRPSRRNLPRRDTPGIFRR